MKEAGHGGVGVGCWAMTQKRTLQYLETSEDLQVEVQVIRLIRFAKEKGSTL